MKAENIIDQMNTQGFQNFSVEMLFFFVCVILCFKVFCQSLDTFRKCSYKKETKINVEPRCETQCSQSTLHTHI